MCYASLAGDDVQCQIGKVQLANTFGRLQDMKPDFNGGEFATRLEDLRRALLELREPRNDACEGLIREALEGIRQPSMSQK